MNNTSTYTYSFSTIKDEFYNDFKGKTIKKKFVDVVDDYDIQPQRPEICPFCSKGKMYIKSTNHCNLKDYSTGPELYIARVKYHTYRCSECHKSLTEEIDFRVPKKQFTWRFLKQALYLILGNGITIKKAAEFMHCAPSLIKEIHKNYLNKVAGTLKPKAGTYSEYIVVDEFLLHKGHRYCTMVLDGRTGCLLYLEPGKGKRQLKHFFDFVGPDFMNHVKACGMDMNCSFNAAIKQYYPHIAVVYDYFHLKCRALHFKCNVEKLRMLRSLLKDQLTSLITVRSINFSTFLSHCFFFLKLSRNVIISGLSSQIGSSIIPRTDVAVFNAV